MTLPQIDEDLTARINLCNARLSFMENDKVYRPNWHAPEGWLITASVWSGLVGGWG